MLIINYHGMVSFLNVSAKNQILLAQIFNFVMLVIEIQKEVIINNSNIINLFKNPHHKIQNY